MGVAVIVIVAVVAGIAALGLLARFLGWGSDGGAGGLRAAATEAGERTADAIAEFWDWLRLGR